MCVAKGKSTKNPSGCGGRPSGINPEGCGMRGASSPVSKPAWPRLGQGGCPQTPKPTWCGWEWRSQHIQPLLIPPGAGRSRGSCQSWWKIRHGNAAWSLLCSLAGTKHRDWRVFTGFVYPKAEGCFHSGSNWKDRTQRAGSRWGELFRLKFLQFSPPPPAQVFPLIRKALCKSSYSEIRGSKKDCNGGMLQSASTAISVIRWKASWITQTERTSVLCVFSGCPQV